MDDRKRVLVTGAAGLVGGHLRSHWGARYALRLADVRPVTGTSPDEDVVSFDISDLEAFTRACDGIDTLVHLAADPSMEADFYGSLLQTNVIGAYNAFEAARRARCQRVVFASSINVVLGYRGQVDVKCEIPPWPVNVYGATKCWAEALARVYSDKHGLSCLCVRIGGARFRQDRDWDPHQRNGGISGRDQAQLFACCVDAPSEIRFKVVNGISRHEISWLSLQEASEIGYEPEDGTAFPRV